MRTRRCAGCGNALRQHGRVVQHNHDRLSPARLQGGGGYANGLWWRRCGHDRLTAYRDLIVDPNTDVIVPQFQTDTASQAGGAFDGLVSVLPLCKAQASPLGTLFLNAADTRTPISTTPNDNTHLKSAGLPVPFINRRRYAAHGYGAVQVTSITPQGQEIPRRCSTHHRERRSGHA